MSSNANRVVQLAGGGGAVGMNPIAARSAIVLIADDNEDHFFLATESFRATHLNVDLYHVETGDQCLAYLRRQPPYEEAPRPDLLLLDIHMPRMDGFEVMAAISADPALRALSVVALSTSTDPADVGRMYALGCSSYIAKPVDYASFNEMVRRLADYWLELVILPNVE